MTDRPRRAKPLITSTLALRVLASAITLSSFGGMTIFASENLHGSNAPLQPTAAVATATPAPTTATTVTTSRTTTTQRSVTSTSTAALTRTKQS